MEQFPFGFIVTRHDNSQDPELWPAGWMVELPHQCDNWQISGSYEPVPHAEAVARLEQFIAEAQRALDALRDGRELLPE